MALSTRIKDALNATLAPLNLKIDTRTVERVEDRRVRGLARSGHFTRPICPVPSSFAPPAEPLVRAIREGAPRFETFDREDRNDVGYSFRNSYFSSPDAEVLYAMLRWQRPSRYVEIGCGNSTRVARQAILDGALATRIVCVDPSPRLSLAGLADEVHQQPVEGLDDSLWQTLAPGDVLFLDSSHDVRPGNDVVHLLLRVLPTLPDGVLVHVHDVFIPYEYPSEWVVGQPFTWSEQYLVAALLAGGRLRALWPGYWLQQTWAPFGGLLPHSAGRRAQSLWCVTSTVTAS